MERNIINNINGDYICPHCRKIIDFYHIGDDYCAKCGGKLEWGDTWNWDFPDVGEVENDC